MELMAATGNAQHYTLSRTDDGGLTLGTAEAAHADALQIRAYTTNRSVEYWLIDKGEGGNGQVSDKTINVKELNITLNKTSYKYTGKAKKPIVNVKFD